MSIDNVTEKDWDEAIRNLASKKQIGGSHYKTLKISPTEYVYANNLSWNLGNVIKYIHRHKYKDANIQDLQKAKWYLDKLIDYYENM